jgi:hypothetical protein
MRAFFCILALTACSGDIGTTGDSGVPEPDASDAGVGSFVCSGASPKFAADVSPILSSCAGGELCHGGLATKSWPYVELVNYKAVRDTCDSSNVLVTPGSLDKSYLMHKLTGVGMCPQTNRMPMGTPLPDEKIQTIADWICQGAQND